MDYDVVIGGAGVIGLACARELSKNNLKCLVVEKHPGFGCETSSRNSEVIHSGIYYPEESLKTKLCVKGNISLYEYCIKQNIEFNKIGKYIVAVEKSERSELITIFNNAKTNGVENIRFAGKGELKKSEPNILAEEALFSPDTGIINSHSLMSCLEEQALGANCDFAYNHSIYGIECNNHSFKILISDKHDENYNISSKYFINACGLDSDIIALSAGLDINNLNYDLQYCKGHYFRIPTTKRHLVNHLIYPVPTKGSPGLGIHLTKELNGDLKLGPDTLYLSSREKNYIVPEDLKNKFYIAVSRYLKGLEIDDLMPDQSGIRPKLQKEGEGFRDFIIREESINGFPGFVNLIGIESPGLTACLEIAKMVGDFIY